MNSSIDLIKLFEGWVKEKKGKLSSYEKLIGEYLEEAEMLLKENYRERISQDININYTQARNSKTQIKNVNESDTTTSRNSSLEKLLVAAANHTVDKNLSTNDDVSQQADIQLEDENEIGSSRSLMKIHLVDIEGMGRRWKNEKMAKFNNFLLNLADMEIFWIFTLSCIWLTVFFNAIDQPFYAMIAVSAVIPTLIVAMNSTDYRRWNFLVSLENAFLIGLIVICGPVIIFLVDENSMLPGILLIIVGLLLVGMVFLFTELIDTSKIILLTLVGLLSSFSIIVMRFYLFGYMYSSFSNDIVIEYENMNLSLLSILGYTSSVIFFFFISKIVNLFFIRFADLPIYIPGVPPHSWKPLIGRLVYREYKMDRYFTDASKLKLVIFANILLTLLSILVFFLHDYVWKTSSYLPA